MIISSPTVRGGGQLTGAFASPDGRILAVASAFPLLTNPPARAAYAGQHLRHRLALYRRGEPVPFAWLDDLRWSVNDVGFHPTDPVIAIAAGSYDGGWVFEGDLVLWDWTADRAWRPMANTPEVVRCAFDESGQRLEALARPWDEEWGSAENAADSFERFYPMTLAYPSANSGGTANAEIDPGTCIVIEDWRAAALAGQVAPEQRLSDWFGAAPLVQRGAIWDVAWLDDGRLAAVHDECLLEVHDLSSGAVKRFDGDVAGVGVAILGAAAPIVHVAPAGPARWAPPRSRLMIFKDDTLSELGAFDGSYDFSSTRGHLLGRLDRHRAAGAKNDLLIDLATGGVRAVDLGHYDCFNHYIGVDGAPDLYCLQGAPPSSHEHKWMCRVRPDGEVKRLWPLLRADGAHASHAMECRGCYVEDDVGAGMVVAGRHYDPTPSRAARGFIYRKPLDADREMWRHATAASASTIVHLSAQGLVAAAFLDGALSLFDAATGAIVATGRVTIDGLPTVIFAMDARDDALAVGTFDGRIAVLSARALTSDAFKGGSIELT